LVRGGGKKIRKYGTMETSPTTFEKSGGGGRTEGKGFQGPRGNGCQGEVESEAKPKRQNNGKTKKQHGTKWGEKPLKGGLFGRLKRVSEKSPKFVTGCRGRG